MVNNAAEQQWLTNTFAPFANLWIGGTDQAAGEHLEWADGSAMTPIPTGARAAVQ